MDKWTKHKLVYEVYAQQNIVIAIFVPLFFLVFYKVKSHSLADNTDIHEALMNRRKITVHHQPRRPHIHVLYVSRPENREVFSTSLSISHLVGSGSGLVGNELDGSEARTSFPFVMCCSFCRQKQSRC